MVSRPLYTTKKAREGSVPPASLESGSGSGGTASRAFALESGGSRDAVWAWGQVIVVGNAPRLRSACSIESLCLHRPLPAAVTVDLRPEASLGHGRGVASPPATVRFLEPIGEARRFACEDGRELWCLPEARSGAAEQLRALGRVGVGGFVDGGRDGEGPWLIRERADRLLAALLGEHEDQ